MTRRDAQSPDWVPLSVQPLLAYLATQRSADCHREQVTEALWPDLGAGVGRRRLNTAVWRTRQLFGGEGRSVLVTTPSGHLWLDRDEVEVDVADVAAALTDERIAAAARGEPAARFALQRAVHCDATTLLSGCYDDWVVMTRERMQQLVLRALELLVETTPPERPSEAIAWAELLVRRNPLREDAHRRLMRLYAAGGRRADALRQFAECEERLRAELGVEPLPETHLVAAGVRAGAAVDPPGDAPVQEVVRELSDALKACRRAIHQIEAALAGLQQA